VVGRQTVEDLQRRSPAGDRGRSVAQLPREQLTDHDLCNGTGMPRGLDKSYRPLPTDVLQAINDWICQGAPNN